MRTRIARRLSVFIMVCITSVMADLPYTLPTPGNVATIGTNTVVDLASVFPAASGNSFFPSVFSSAFGSGVFIRDYSAHGAYVLAGIGGHAAPFQLTGAILFDYDDATWRGFENANGVPSYTGQSTGTAHANDRTWGEWSGTEVPLPCHSYLAPAELPASLGGGPKGSLLYLGRGAVFEDGAGARGPHAFNLETKRWSRLTSADHPRVAGIYTSVVFDEANGRYYPIGNIEATKQRMYYDASNWDSLYYTWPQYGWPAFGGGACAFMDSVHRLIIDFASPELHAFQLDNPGAGWKVLNVSGTLPPAPTEPCRWTYYPPDGNYYFRPLVNGGTKLYRLTPPAADPLTAAWIADSVELNQTMPDCQAPSWYNFLFYVPSIGCLSWIPSVSSPVYIFKPPVVDSKIETPAAALAPSRLSAQPNPFTASVRLDLAGVFSNGSSVRIFDLSGRIVADLSGNIKNSSVSWNGSSMAAGIYTVVVRKGALESAKRIFHSK